MLRKTDRDFFIGIGINNSLQTYMKKLDFTSVLIEIFFAVQICKNKQKAS